GGLFRESPGGKVERVDEDRDSAQRRPGVLAPESGRAPELAPFSVDEEAPTAQLLPQISVVAEDAARSVEVELRVLAGHAGVAQGESDQLLARIADHLRHAHQELAPLGEG